MSPEFRANETPIPAATLRCICGGTMHEDDVVWHIDGDEYGSLDIARGDGQGEGDVFCSSGCAREARLDNYMAAWFEDAAYGRG